MALSVKVALLTCLFFTGGICWLVNQVARSADGQLQAFAKRAAQNVSASPAVDLPTPEGRPVRLERESPVSRFGEPATRTVVFPEVALVSGPPEDQPVPPLQSSLLEMRSAAETAQQEVILAEPAADPIPEVTLAPDLPKRSLLEARRASTPYTVRKGDSLVRICRAHYGDQFGEGQRLLIAENPQIARRARLTIFEGETIQLPALDGATSVAASDADGMEASDSFVVQVVPEPAPASPQGAEPAAKRPARASMTARVVKTPPKSDSVRKTAKSTPGKTAVKSGPAKRSERPVAAVTAGKKGTKAVQASRETRGVKSAAATARRGSAPPPKAASGKRPTNPDKRDARRPGGGNVVLARRD